MPDPMSPASSGRGADSRPPTTYFGISQRLLRGYGPVAVLAALLVVVALAVPSKVPKAVTASSSSNQSQTNNNPANSTANNTPLPGTSGSGAQGGSTPSGASSGSSGAQAGSSGSSGSSGSAGQAGTAGRTVTVPGNSKPCAGQALQVPGDPYSPPCLAFSGNNGGATATGVTGNTITISVRLTSDQSFGQTLAQLAGAQLRDTNADNVRTIDALAQYFNTHFQFYGRKLVIKTFNGQGSLSAELLGNGQAQAEADATTAKSLGAFADMTAESEPYATALQRQGIMGFGDPYMPGFWHQSHAPYDWSIATDGTHLAQSIGEYAVQKLCGGNADYAGGSLKGQPRKIAGIAPANELYQDSAKVFKQVMNAAGCSVDNYSYTLDLGTESQQAENLVAQLKSKGYTTIICGCDPIFPVYLTGQEASQSYLPEFVEIGAALVDQDYVGQLYNQTAYAHAFGISPNEPTVPYDQTIGYAAYKTVSPTTEPAFFVNNIYLQMDMLAIGIEMAGPDLTPANFQAGMFRYQPRNGPAGLWGWNSSQYTTPNDFREVCWSPSTISPYNNKQGAYIPSSSHNARWTIQGVPKGKPGCPIPS